MIDLGKDSTLNADQILERAVKFFGEGEERCSQVMLTRIRWSAHFNITGRYDHYNNYPYPLVKTVYPIRYYLSQTKRLCWDGNGKPNKSKLPLMVSLRGLRYPFRPYRVDSKV